MRPIRLTWNFTQFRGAQVELSHLVFIHTSPLWCSPAKWLFHETSLMMITLLFFQQDALRALQLLEQSTHPITWGKSPHVLSLVQEKKKSCYKFSARWCNAFKGSDELHTLNISQAVSSHWAKQHGLTSESTPNLAVPLPHQILPQNVHHWEDSSRTSPRPREEHFRRTADCLSEGRAWPQCSSCHQGFWNTNGGVSSHLVLTCPGFWSTTQQLNCLGSNIISRSVNILLAHFQTTVQHNLSAI